MASSAPYMIRSATDFLPRVIRTFMNLATSSLLNFGSGRISRLGTSLRRGMESSDWNGDQEKGLASLEARSRLRGLGSLRAVLRARLLPVLDARGIQGAAHHVVAPAREALPGAAADEHHRVLLQVVAFAADVADDFVAV